MLATMIFWAEVDCQVELFRSRLHAVLLQSRHAHGCRCGLYLSRGMPRRFPPRRREVVPWSGRGSTPPHSRPGCRGVRCSRKCREASPVGSVPGGSAPFAARGRPCHVEDNYVDATYEVRWRPRPRRHHCPVPGRCRADRRARRGGRGRAQRRRRQRWNRRRRGREGGRPPSAFDPVAYCERSVVERCFARLKQIRTIATRYDKLAACHTAGVVLASLILWLREPQR